MLVKNFFFNFYTLLLNISFYIFLAIFFLSVLLITSNLRNKLFYFIFSVILFSVFGFTYNLDGIFLIFLTAEFTIFLLILMTYSHLYNNFSFFNNKKKIRISFFILILFPNYYIYNFSFYFTSFYKTIFFTNSSDFFILYNFLFFDLPFSTILIILIISFFSFFFIILYYNLKLLKVNNNNLNNQIFFLRKQSFTKQTNFKNNINGFQN